MTEQHDIQITAAAGQHIQRQLQQTQCEFLRLGVKESGCNGYMYTLDFLEQPADNDLKFSFDQGVQVCVAQNDWPLVQGTEVDMVTEGLNSALVFKNSKAASYCGCGESFSMDQAMGPDGVDAGDLATEVSQ